MRRIVGLIFPCLIISSAVMGIQRFPPPQFESGYALPQTSVPPPLPVFRDWLDIFVLFFTLCFASYLTLKKRSRRWIAGLMVFSLLYFGFWRKGCVCSVGSIGNIALAAMDSSYALPAAVLVFFLMPLIFTLFFGRGFCAAVCPLGAVQDAVLIRPMRISNALEAGLRLFAYLYLALAVLFAAAGGVFIICRYDPFVVFFRFNANWHLWVLGVSFVVISLFVGRPYCRFLCPYGVILRQLGRLSKWRVTITPEKCIQCRLCEQSCPFNAVDKPVRDVPPAEIARGKRRIIILVMLLPILMVLGGWIGAAVSPVLARMAPAVHLAEQEGVIGMNLQAEAVRQWFYYGSIAAGVFMGFVAGGKLISASIIQRRKDYEAHRAGCFACGRCFEYCPIEVKRRLDKD